MTIQVQQKTLIETDKFREAFKQQEKINLK